MTGAYATACPTTVDLFSSNFLTLKMFPSTLDSEVMKLYRLIGYTLQPNVFFFYCHVILSQMTRVLIRENDLSTSIEVTGQIRNTT